MEYEWKCNCMLSRTPPQVVQNLYVFRTIFTIPIYQAACIARASSSYLLLKSEKDSLLPHKMETGTDDKAMIIAKPLTTR